MLSRDEILREVTLRICSGLEIKETLRNAFEYLREHFPLDGLTLFIQDERMGAIRHIAHAFNEGAVPPDEIIPWPEGMPEKIAARNYSAPFIVDAEADEIFRYFAPLVGLEGNTDLIVPLRMSGTLLGGLTLRVRGARRYTEEQVEFFGCIARPFAIAVSNALAHEEVLRYQAILLDDKRFLNRELHHGAAGEVIGGETGLRKVMEMVRQVAPLNNTVLLLGETGTGKEMIADAIHFSSPRKDGPYIKVNCGALPENLIDSELFGHEKGAFTGAVAESRGRFERADGGTIFLDEIGELSPTAQVQAPSGAAGSRGRAGRGKAPDPRRRPRDRGDAPRSAEHDYGRPLPRGPLVSAERLSHPRAAGAAAEERHPGSHTPFRHGEEQGIRHRGPALHSPRGASAAYGVRLARERARAGEHGRTRTDPAPRRSPGL